MGSSQNRIRPGKLRVQVNGFLEEGAFGHSYVPQMTPSNQQESVTPSCDTRSHPWELLRLSRSRRSVQENSGTPCAGNSIPALTSGLTGWKHSSENQYRP